MTEIDLANEQDGEQSPPVSYDLGLETEMALRLISERLASGRMQHLVKRSR
jgi:hypothetical protein